MLSALRESGHSVTAIWATWFLERWPGWRMSEVEPEAASCRRCRDPADVIGILRDP